ASWNLALARTGLELIANRREVVELLAAPLAEHAAELGLAGAAKLAYRARSAASTPEEFVAELEARLDADLQRGYTTHGPHRDELVLSRDGRSLREYASQGEQRPA